MVRSAHLWRDRFWSCVAVIHSPERGPRRNYEILTYQFERGSVAEVEKRFAQACDYREKYPELTGSRG